MKIESMKANLNSAIEKVDRLIRLAKEGLRYGANEEVYPWQARSEFDCEEDTGLREELIREFGGNPFSRASWDEYGGYYYLDEDEKNRFGNSYQNYVDQCNDKCSDIFAEIIASLEEYKNYLYSIAGAAE